MKQTVEKIKQNEDLNLGLGFQSIHSYFSELNKFEGELPRGIKTVKSHNDELAAIIETGTPFNKLVNKGNCSSAPSFV